MDYHNRQRFFLLFVNYSYFQRKLLFYINNLRWKKFKIYYMTRLFLYLRSEDKKILFMTKKAFKCQRLMIIKPYAQNLFRRY